MTTDRTLKKLSQQGLSGEEPSRQEPSREEMLRLLAARRAAARRAARPAIPPRDPAAEVPLTPAQHRLWFLEQASAGGSTYLTWSCHRLSGQLDHAALRVALRVVVGRHEALRTAVTMRDGQPVQVVVPAGELDAGTLLETHEVVGGTVAEREQAAVRQAVATATRPFVLDLAPLARVALIRLDDLTHLLVCSFHHLLFDGQSTQVVLDELFAGYRAAVTGQPAELAPVAVQFPDYAVWLTGQDSGGAGERSGDAGERYWTEHLDGVPALLDLPTDRARPPLPTRRGRSHTVRLPAVLAAAARGLARQQRCSLFTVLLAALNILLVRHSGQEDVVVGTPVANRLLPELERTVGMFVNTLALRTDLRGNPRVREVLDRVHATTTGGLRHQAFPFDRLVELLQPRRDLSHNPLFQVMLAFNQATTEPISLPGLTVEWVELAPPDARFDLTVFVYDGHDLEVRLDAAADLFDPATVARLGEHLERVLAAMVAGPEQRLWDVPLLTDAERQALTGAQRSLAGGPEPSDVATGAKDDAEGCVHEQIAEAAAATPSAPAVVTADGMLTYQQLDRRANHLAARLHALGVGVGASVGIVLPTGPDALVAIVGVLKAGGAYVPLDPTHPPQRLTALLTDANAPVAISAPQRVAALAGWGGHVLLLGEEEAAEAPPVTVTPDDLAYVIFTSGSTGQPKGVMITHATLARLTRAFRDVHRITPNWRLLMLPPLTFDASVGDVFPALSTGATLVLHPEPAALTGPELVRFCARHRVTAVDTAVALWQRWVDDLAGQPVGDGPPVGDDWPVTVMMVGGEPVPLHTLRTWARLTGGRVRLYNHYGPTEATVCATVHATVDGAEAGDAAHLPIGRPLPHVRADVLDSHGSLAPIGVPGELHLGGGCLARGYLGQPDLTTERFVPDPFAPEADARAYRTGDLARWRDDGTLEFLGRLDRQVKIRGHRIEPGEVEAVLTRHADVRDAVVLAREDRSGQRRLVAYVVPHQPARPTPQELREHTGGSLPGYLTPSAFVLLEALPLTAHGKIDVAALPALQDATSAYVAPSGAVETRLASIWAELLGRGRVGRHDGFFELGGHSLLSAPLLARVQTAFGVTLPLRALFETADLAELATLITRTRATGATPPERRDLRAEAVLPLDLPADLRPTAPAGLAAPPRRVLLTGATGFLGAYLLSELLERTDATVWCLVRADDHPKTRAGTHDGGQAAADRIRRSLERHSRWQERYAGRIVPLMGDLAAARLGLPPDRFDELAGQIDLVVHNGGMVGSVHPYERLKPANVGGTLEVLRLAAHRGTPVHHVSTLGVFAASGSGGVAFRETDDPPHPEPGASGYDQSKWVADRLVRAARQRGLPASVHRPARVSGDSRTGRGNPDDWFNRMVRTCAQLGMVPELEEVLDLAPVDHVAAAVAHLAVTGHHGLDFHYFNAAGLTTEDLAPALAERGIPAALVPYPRWRRAVVDRAATDPRLPFAPLAAGLPEDTTAWQPDLDCQATDDVLATVGLRCPPADAVLLGRYLDVLAGDGLLERA